MSDDWESGGSPGQQPGKAQWPGEVPSRRPGLGQRLRSTHIAVKITGLVVAILVALFGIGAALNWNDCGSISCDDGDDVEAAVDQTPRNTAVATMRTLTQEQPTPPDDTPTPEPTVPPATSTPEPTPTVHAVIGTTIEAKGSRYTVNAVRDPFVPDATFFQPTPGARWVGVDITQEGVAEADDYNPFYFFVQDANDFVYSYQFLAAPEPRMDSGQLLAGQRTRGWVGFEVPTDAVIVTVLTQPEPLGPKIVIADLR